MEDSFLSDLSNPDQPIPGGGAAAAYTGIVGLALLEKIVGIEMRRRPGVSEDYSWEKLSDQISALGQELYRLRDEDGKSYMRLAKAEASGKGEAEFSAALQQAIDCPVKIMEQAHSALGCVLQASEYCKKHLLSDLQVVAEFLGAAGRGAEHIARANLSLMADPILKADYQSRLFGLSDDRRKALKLLKTLILNR